MAETPTQQTQTLSQAAQAAARPAYLDNLNPPQREAVEALDGPVLVLAGAGTGKTRVLITRLAHLLITRKAYPSQILAVTFTNKAALEMRERVAKLIGEGAQSLWLGTFHSISARILRKHAERVGLKPNFTILDDDDQMRLIKQQLAALNIDDKRWPARVVHNAIQRWKDRGLRPEQVSVSDAGDLASGRARDLYKAYQERLRALNAVDFGDLLLHCLTLFTQHPDVLAEYHGKFKYLMVDEYQDTNVAQYLWLRLLAQASKNICCVGDDDQSIYGWRGAEIGNILKFEKDFPGAKIIRLEQNYRSTPHILAAASALIAHNEGRLGKTLWTERNEGEKLQLRGVWDGGAEARAVGETIEVLQRKQHALREMAILVRAGFQTREFEERFITLGIPYRVIGGPRFYERMEIRDAIAYFRLINQRDDDLAFERIVNKPKRGLGDQTVAAIHQLARAKQVSLGDAAALILETDELKPQAKRGLGRLVADLARWRGLIDAVSHVELAETVLEESGYIEMWQNDKTPEAPGRLENLKELVRALEEFENLGGFLEHVSLVMEANENSSGDMVNVMTLHSAKGLEFDSVFLPGWEEGVFPHQRALDESGQAGLEEERRLAYVGITRAKQRVFISFAANRRIHNLWQSAIPSRFIDELPPQHVEIVRDEGLYGGAHVSDVPQRGYDDGYRAGGGVSNENYWLSRAKGGGARGRVFDAATGTALRAPAVERFTRGDRVFHQKFGYGTVNQVDGDKLVVKFDHSDEKKLMDNFVKKA